MDLYSPVAQLCVGISGSSRARAHFEAEYGAARVSAGRTPDVAVEVRFAGALPGGPPRDGHKTVRWSVELGDPGAQSLRARITIAGRPRRFALSMVQGFVVEPLVSLAASRTGLVLLPAAALVEDGGAVVVLGRSRSGKTSVVARAVAEGRSALGDDQVLVDAEGRVSAWPRRLRVYSDLRITAPSAVAALPARYRRSLHVMRWAKVATRGHVAPSLPLPWTAVGAPPVNGGVPITRVVVVERGGTDDAVAVAPLELTGVTDLARTILVEQRTRFGAVAGPHWDSVVAEAAAAEERTLTVALSRVPAEQWTVPGAWDAARAVGELSAALGG